jgi:hypothetical protein
MKYRDPTLTEWLMFAFVTAMLVLAAIYGQ